MKLNGPLATRLLSAPAAVGIRAWMRTLDYRVLYHDETVDPLLHQGPPRIYLFWHESILVPLYLRGNCHVAMLLSQHRDADILARIAARFGYDCVRGSTYRGGARAMRELAAAAQTHHLAITPDGPRGPRRRLAQGAIFLASRLSMPIVCMGFAAARPYRTPTWDRFAIPRPFSRVRAVVSGEVHIPLDIDRDGIEHWRVRVEQKLNGVTEEAERWAAAGDRRAAERPVGRGSAPAPDWRLGVKPRGAAA